MVKLLGDKFGKNKDIGVKVKKKDPQGQQSSKSLEFRRANHTVYSKV